jgi:hypothetical protein
MCAENRAEDVGGGERGAPTGAQAVSRDRCFSAEHPLGLFADGPLTRVKRFHWNVGLSAVAGGDHPAVTAAGS